eukprot:m.62251 g.62251  ORF g.62251 m.62251 type:complete len:443 (-) comp7394_c0_seq1:93-1421(-)
MLSGIMRLPKSSKGNPLTQTIQQRRLAARQQLLAAPNLPHGVEDPLLLIRGHADLLCGKRDLGAELGQLQLVHGKRMGHVEAVALRKVLAIVLEHLHRIVENQTKKVPVVPTVLRGHGDSCEVVDDVVKLAPLLHKRIKPLENIVVDDLVVVALERVHARATRAAHVLDGALDHKLVNVDHRHKLGVVLEQLVQNAAVTAAKNEDILALVVLTAIASDGKSVGKVALGQVGVVVEEEHAAVLVRLVDFDVLEGRILLVEEPRKVVLHEAAVGRLKVRIEDATAHNGRVHVQLCGTRVRRSDSRLEAVAGSERISASRGLVRIGDHGHINCHQAIGSHTESCRVGVAAARGNNKQRAATNRNASGLQLHRGLRTQPRHDLGTAGQKSTQRACGAVSSIACKGCCIGGWEERLEAEGAGVGGAGVGVEPPAWLLRGRDAAGHCA